MSMSSTITADLRRTEHPGSSGTLSHSNRASSSSPFARRPGDGNALVLPSLSVSDSISTSETGKISPVACRFFARGQCLYGDRCRYHHTSARNGLLTPTDEIPSSSSTDSSLMAVATCSTMSAHLESSQAQTRTSRQKRKSCFAWIRKGSCVKGDKCPYAHAHAQTQNGLVPTSVSVSATSTVAQSSITVSTSNPQKLRRQLKVAESRPSNREEDRSEKRGERERTAATALAIAAEKKKDQREEARATIQRVLLGSTLVTFSAGVNIGTGADSSGGLGDFSGAGKESEGEATEREMRMGTGIVPGFETCRVVIRNIPPDLKIEQVQGFLRDCMGVGHGKDGGAGGNGGRSNQGKGKAKANYEEDEDGSRSLNMSSTITNETQYQDDRFLLVSLKRNYQSQSQEGVVVAHTDTAKEMVRRLDGLSYGSSPSHFQTHTLKVEFNGSGSGVYSSSMILHHDHWKGYGGNKAGGVTLKVSWKRSNSVKYVVEYESVVEVEDSVERFNGNIAFGRRVRVARDFGPDPNRGRNRGGILATRASLTQVLVSGLPPEVEEEAVRKFFGGTTAQKISGSSSTSTYDEAFAKDRLKMLLSSKSNSSPEFDEPSKPDAIIATDHILYARFADWEVAKQVYDSLLNKKFEWIGNASFRLSLPDPIQYSITIPYDQYEVQIASWKALLVGTTERQRATGSANNSFAPSVNRINMWINEKSEKGKAFIHISGTDAKAVGMLKVRVENLAAGEKLGGLWHRSFASESGRAFLRSLSLPHTLGSDASLDRHAYAYGDVLVVSDWRRKNLKAYGDPPAIERAREAIERELDRLAGMEYTVPLKRDSVRFFAKRGVKDLKERFGEECVSLNISSSPCRITIRGGEDARYALHSLIDQSLSMNNSRNDLGSDSDSDFSCCPICLDRVSVSVQLGCGHAYCSACLHHFFTADSKNFPIICLGDEGQCRRPIALPTIQRFLTEVQFNTLLETAFLHYVETHPDMLKYCSTPDCERLYRCAPSNSNSSINSNLQCPSCFSDICSRCHEEAHEGITCTERQEQAASDWATKAGFKKCPACKVWIEKTDGCNHIHCRCGVHICWQCMGIFNVHTIYPHMHTVHGGIGTGDGYGFIRNVDINAQARELENWNHLATVRRAWEPAYYEPVWPVIEPPRNDFHQNRVLGRDMETAQRLQQDEGGTWCMIM